MIRRTVTAAIAATALALLAACTGAGTDTAVPPGPAQSPVSWAVPCPAPEPPATGEVSGLSLPCLGGGAAAPIAGGAPTVVNVWASWCAPCRDELPQIQAYAEAHPEVTVLGVNTQDTDTAARSLAADLGLTFPSRADPEGRLMALVGKRTLPLTLFIAADGTVAEVYAGTPLTADVLASHAAEHLGTGA